MKRPLVLLAAAALLCAGCDNSGNPTTKSGDSPKPGTPVSAPAAEPPALSPAAVEGGKVKLTEANTRVSFIGRKPDGKHDGRFDKLSGEITVNDKGTPTAISVEFDTESIWSDADGLTKHLKNDDFFQAKQHPKITFKSTKVEPASDGATVTGDLTIRGQTKPVTFPVKSQVEGGKLKLAGEIKINRKDFGMTYGAGKINDEVDVKVQVGEAK